MTSGLTTFGIQIDTTVAERELVFLNELLRWNLKINLTSIVDYTDAVEKHLIDSLFLVNYFTAGKTILDMGSGAGLPGIPLALARPELNFISVDSVGKKINFQKHIKRLLQLENFKAIVCRVEQLDDRSMTGKIDFVIARAFTDLKRLIELAAPLLVANGCLLAMKGPEADCEVGEASQVAKENNFTQLKTVKYRLPFSQAERQLIVLQKNSP